MLTLHSIRAKTHSLNISAPRILAVMIMTMAAAAACENHAYAQTAPSQAKAEAQAKAKTKKKTPAKGKKASQSVPPGEPHIYKEVAGRKLKLYVTRPKTSGAMRPAIVFFHGGGWVGGAPGQFTEHAKHYAELGIVCFQVQYRLLNRSKNDPPTHCIHDAKSAMRWVRSRAKEFGVDPNRIASAGGSAGGHLAAFVGLAEGVDDPQDDKNVSAKSNAMLLFNPVFDNGPGGWGQKRVGDRYKEFSPVHNISEGDPPAIVFLGSNDKLIPVATAEQFKQQMKDIAPCEVHIYEGQPHGFFNSSRSNGKYYRLTVAAADKFLAKLGWLNPETSAE